MAEGRMRGYFARDRPSSVSFADSFPLEGGSQEHTPLNINLSLLKFCDRIERVGEYLTIRNGGNDEMERVEKFLKEAGDYYLATVDGDQPRVSPFGTAHIF